jgi:hypothetical protein
MRMKRQPETDEQRSMRAELRAGERKERSYAEDKALDAAVRNSIKLYGA